MDKVVVSIGGSVLIPEKDDAVYIKALADMLKDVAKEVCLMVVCGGGKIARYYTTTGKAFYIYGLVIWTQQEKLLKLINNIKFLCKIIDFMSTLMQIIFYSQILSILKQP